MDAKELEAFKKLKDGLMSINGALSKLGKDKDDLIVCLPSSEFAYFKTVLDSGVSSASNFYTRVSDDEFQLSGIRIKKYWYIT